MKSKSFLPAVAVILAATAVCGMESDYVMTCLDTEASLQWKTIATNTMPVAIDWPENAVKVVISGGAEAVTVTDTTKLTADVTFALPTSEQNERVFTLVATYYAAGDVEISSESVRLALVVGTDPTQSVRFKNKAAANWGRARCVRPLLPLPAGTTALTNDNVAVSSFDIEPRGWHAVTLGNAGSDLILSVGETQYEATLYPPNGFIVTFH